MNKLKRWRVEVTIDASSCEFVHAATKEEAEEKGLIAASAHGICHQCSRHISLGDVIEAVECEQEDE